MCAGRCVQGHRRVSLLLLGEGVPGILSGLRRGSGAASFTPQGERPVGEGLGAGWGGQSGGERRELPGGACCPGAGGTRLRLSVVQGHV